MRLLDVRRALWAPLYMTAATLLAAAIAGPLDADGSIRFWLPTAVGLLCGLLCLIVTPRGPSDLIEFLQPRKRLTAVAVVLACLAFVQTARQSAFVADSEFHWGRALPSNTTNHSCLASYIRGAEINRDELAPLYERTAYDRDTTIPTSIVGLGDALGDPFVYPPQALLLPRLGIALSSRLSTLQAVWLALSSLLFGIIALLVARHMKGQARSVAWLLVPAVWISLPVAYNLEYGQVHLLTIATAMAAMLAFAHQRDLLGGSLLALAIGWKLFPGILVVYLLVQKRWRPALYTIACSIALAAITLGVVGWQAYYEFLWGHLPRLASGQAFERYFAWDEVTAQLSLAGQARVLGMGAGIGKALGWLYSATTLIVTFLAARRSEASRPLVWLAILNLAAMQSPFAPASYLAGGIVWLLSLWAADPWQQQAQPGRMILAGVLALFVQTAPFLSSLPGLWNAHSLHFACALIATIVAIAICIHSSLATSSRQNPAS